MEIQPIEFRPDYAQKHAGAYLSLFLDERGIKRVDFAKKCGRTSKTISEIIAGKAPITPETALQFERVLGESAGFWLNLEAKFQLQQLRAKETAKAQSEKAKNWASAFPIAAMTKAGFLQSSLKKAERAEALLRFFGVSSIDAFNAYWDKRVAPIRFKQQQEHTINDKAVIAWLRQGELVAANRNCEPYDESRFRAVLAEVRSLTKSPWAQVESRLIDLCAECGVAVAPVRSLPNTGLRGAAYWVKKDKAVIVLSDRGKHEEAFWFSFFHEAAHILLHSKKSIFIDQEKAGNDEASIETEADRFSAEFLVPSKDIDRFVSIYGSNGSLIDPDDLERFAEDLGISPGLLLVRLQYEGVISYQSRLNSKLKRPAVFGA